MDMKPKSDFSIKIEGTVGSCPVGEKWGSQNAREGKIPVISCEGACIRGEIARLAANLVSKEEPYRRGCHGEMFTVPGSAIAQWMRASEKVVVIDGCFLQCHGRVMKHLVAEERLVLFDALAVYKKYTDLFDIEAVPEAERRRVARLVADTVISALGKGAKGPASSGCGSAQPAGFCGREK